MGIRETYICDEIDNHSEANKWMWIILMGFTFITATRAFVEFPWTVPSAPDCPEFLISYLILLVFIYRFFVGDRKIVEYVYGSLPKALAEHSTDSFKMYLGCISREVLIFDGVSRVIQLLVFVLAAASIQDRELFIFWLTVLLIVNCGVCLVALEMSRTNADVVANLSKKVLGKEFRIRSYRKIWALNNGYTVLLLILISSFSYEPGIEERQVIAGLFALSLNCVVDLGRCHHLYLPNYKSLYTGEA